MDIGFRCTLECPGCSRQRDYKNVRPVPGRDTTIPEWELLTDFFDEIQLKVKKFVAGNEFEGTMLKPKFGDASGVRGAARLGRTMSY